MDMGAWMRRLWQGMGAGVSSETDAGRWSGGLNGDYGGSGSVLRGLTGRSMEMAEAQAEVAAECRGQILVASRDDDAVRLLLAHLRGQPPAPPAGPVYHEGFFTLATLPDAAADRSQPAVDFSTKTGWATEEWVELGREADVLLYVYRRDAGWEANDARWYARLHATGLPLVLVEADLLAGPAGDDLPPDPLGESDLPPVPLPTREGEKDAPSAATALPAGDRTVQVCLSDVSERGSELPADVVNLVERILAQRPKLGIPLAQEIPGCRPLIAQRAIRSGMLMTTLLGAEPIPLLDLPLQVALNWKLALQLAAIHGRPGLDYRSREMVGTVLWNMILRYIIQQTVKLVPVLGWVVSAALSGAGTWILGSALVRYYQESGSRHQASGDKWHLRIADSPLGWQSAKRKGYQALEDLRETPARWWQVTAARYTGLRGWLVAKTVSLGKRQATVTADGPEGGFHV